MLKANRSYILVLLIFTFSFVYRMLLMLWTGFPPGADIGLHNSVIHSITGVGPNDFFYNFYHIGGGVSLTFPGYHIFTSGVMMLMGVPAEYEFMAHVAVVALFSSLTVLVAFLVTKRIWSISAAYVVAFLAMLSRFDIEMLAWAGYPNVITLLLIPLTFYLYLEKDRFSKVPFFASTAILISSLFLTHSLSAGIFAAITVAAILGVLMFPKKLGTNRKTAFYWFLPIIIGVALVAPFVVQAVPAYLQGNAYLQNATGSSDIGNATLSTKVLPLIIVLPLFGLIPAFAALSKKYFNRWLTLPTFLLAIWVFVSLILTQGYLVKFPFDYNRFLYFLILPLLIFLAVLIDFASGFLARIIDTYRTLTKQIQPTQKVLHKRLNKISKALTRKNLYSIFVLTFLVLSFVALPILMTPTFTNVGQSIQNFYQTMNSPGWEALKWAKTNTQNNAAFVADAEYGWWFGGFALRPTLSAVDPQYLSLNREVDNATFARNLIDTDYMIDNGLVQVREDGGYIGRHNPEFLAKIRNEYYPYPFFNFDNDGIEVTLINGEETQIVNISKVPVIDMHMENTTNAWSIVVTHGNELFNYTQIVTVYAGSPLANITERLTTNNPNVTFITLRFNLYTKSSIAPIISENHSNIGLMDKGMKTLGQLSFLSEQSRPYDIVPAGADKDYSPVELIYKFDMQTNVGFSFYMGTYQYTDAEIDEVNSGKMTYADLVNNNLQEHLINLQQLPTSGQASFTVFDYQQELINRQISYIALRINKNDNPEKTEIDVDPKFGNDPLFSRVFNNEEVAIYKVNGNLK